LTQLFNTTAVPSEVPALAPEVRKKRSWLPLLTVLFLISYGLMTMLIIEQGYTIESQRALIRELFRDSSELTATKMKAQRDRTVASGQRAPSPKMQAPSTQIPMTQAPSTQTPSTQVPTEIPADQSPSSQAAPQTGIKKPAQKQFRMPSKPASELIDDRRALITI
jgi:hypothetical protein